MPRIIDRGNRAMAAHFFSMFPNGGWLSFYAELPTTEQRGWWIFKKTITTGTRKVERSPRVHTNLTMLPNGCGFTAEPVSITPIGGSASYVGIHASETGEVLEMVSMANVTDVMVVTFTWTIG